MLSIPRFISALFTTARPVISRPRPVATGVMQVRSCAQGDNLLRLADKVAKFQPRHADAVETATANAMMATARNKALGALPWQDTHLVHVVFAPGTKAKAAAGRLPIGVRGTQMGAAALVRGRNGHLHAYALVHVG